MIKANWFHYFSLFLLLTVLVFAASCSGIEDPLAEEEANTVDKKAPAPSSLEELSEEEIVDTDELSDDLGQVDW